MADMTWRIEDAARGYSAVDRVTESVRADDRFALAFVDLHLPGMDGIATLEQLWEVDEALQMVMCTGSRALQWDRVLRRVGQRRVHLLRKPFAAESAVMVAEVLTVKWLRTHGGDARKSKDRGRPMRRFATVDSTDSTSGGQVVGQECVRVDGA